MFMGLHNFRTPEYKNVVFRMPFASPPVCIFPSLRSEQLDALFIFDIREFILHRSVPGVFKYSSQKNAALSKGLQIRIVIF
jgi:hypothetical protein